MKSFKSWTNQEMLDTFGLREKEQLESLKSWLAAEPPISEIQGIELQTLARELAHNVAAWNEEELKLHFIALLFRLVQFGGPGYKLFAERKLTADVDGIRLSGDVDVLLAAGQFDPRAPFFCLHEYKRERGKDNDPRGQLLAEMLAAQALNKESWPIYGSYVLGRNWFFCTLEQRDYAFSFALDATKPAELTRIFQALLSIKGIVESRLN